MTAAAKASAEAAIAPPPDVSGLPEPGGSAPEGLAGGLEAAGRGTSEDEAGGTSEAFDQNLKINFKIV